MRHVVLLVCLTAMVAAASTAAPLPSPAIPDFQGERYQVLMPLTLDLAEQIKLSINALTRSESGPPTNPFPSARYPSSDRIDMSKTPPALTGKVILHGSSMLGLLMAREVTGNRDRVQADRDWRAGWLEWQEINPLLTGPRGGRLLEWMARQAGREPEPDKTAWTMLCRRAVDKLYEAAIEYGDAAFIHVSSTIPDEGYATREAAVAAEPNLEAQLKAMTSDIEKNRPKGHAATADAWTVQGLCALYRSTQDKAALDLAGRLALYLKDYSGLFGTAASSSTPPSRYSLQAAIALAEYGATAHDRTYLEFANDFYGRCRRFISPETGFAPRFPVAETGPRFYSSVAGDLALLATWITRGGFRDHWDDVDRIVRNQLVELQLRGVSSPGEQPQSQVNLSPFMSAAVGAFAAESAPNDLAGPDPGLVMDATGESVRTLFYIWEGLVQFVPGFQQGELHVNLLLNHSSEAADVTSNVPYDGRLVAKVKKNCSHVYMRKPEWVGLRSLDVVCYVDRKPVPVKWQGRFIDAGAVKEGQTVEFGFPMPEKSVKADINDQTYTLQLKGSTVVAIDPPGTRIPLYQRSYYIEGRCPIAGVGRFIEETPKQSMRPEVGPRKEDELYK